MSSIAGKTVLITGASRGIGAAAVFEFAKAGANVVLAARSGEIIDKLAAQIGPQACAVVCDVAKYGDVKTAVDRAVAEYGGLDVLINNAGTIDPIASLAGSDPEVWGAAIDTNLKAVFYGMHAALPVMQAGGGTIITVSSGAAHSPLEGWSAYCASKAGAAMLTRCADMELAGTGLRIMGLSPGTVATDMQVAIKASGINPVSQLDPSVHVPADWPAKALLWMCSSDADAYLGQEISLRDEDIRARIGLTLGLVQ